MEAAPGPPASDQELVARFQGGDEAAFDELVERHRAAVYRLAYRLTGCHEDADDLSQETFFRAYRALERFRGEALFRTWITRIAVNQAQNMRRARHAALPLEEARHLAASGGGGQESALRAQVRRAVEKMPPRRRQVLILKAFEGMTFAEIAGAAGISVGTAKATFFQAVRALRERLRPAGGGQAPGSGRAGRR